MARSTLHPSPRLLALCRRRWALPILAELQRGERVSGWHGGAKFVTLCHRLGANQAAVRQSLDHLIEMGLVAANSGHGHPLRPEYVLTRPGDRVAPACERIDDLLERLKARPVGLRRWSLPILQVVDRLEPARFTAIGAAIGGVTDRALALSLKGLCGADLLERQVVDTFPVGTLYHLNDGANELAPLLTRV